MPTLPPPPFLILPMAKVSKNSCIGDFYRRLTYFFFIFFSQNTISMWFFLEFEVVVIYSFMCKFLPKIGFLCNVIFKNNSEFKCFVKRKIGALVTSKS
jgi:hypothetical protein